jgi:malate dehydrogenase (oxaloacetate-decarboxylating)
MIRPGQIIFALSNPRPEIDATLAIDAGARIAEGGAAVNNLLCYPGACRGLLDSGARSAPQAVFQAASRALVAITPAGQLLPNPLEKRVHSAVARAVARAAVKEGVATRELDADYFAEE